MNIHHHGDVSPWSGRGMSRWGLLERRRSSRQRRHPWRWTRPAGKNKVILKDRSFEILSLLRHRTVAESRFLSPPWFQTRCPSYGHRWLWQQTWRWTASWPWWQQRHAAALSAGRRRGGASDSVLNVTSQCSGEVVGAHRDEVSSEPRLVLHSLVHARLSAMKVHLGVVDVRVLGGGVVPPDDDVLHFVRGDTATYRHLQNRNRTGCSRQFF